MSIFSLLRLIFVGAVLAFASNMLARAPAAAESAGIPTDQICERHIAEAEKALDIPSQLLHAIGLVESGTWNEARARSVPWPWTVYAQNRGRRFATKEEALAEVERLYAQGVRNIDVGCMQVNLRYHGEAFGSFAEMLDPAHNVAYAALLLKKLYHDARSWSLAIARYHSWTPKFSRVYHKKVTDAWGTARRTAYEDRLSAGEQVRQARRAERAERRRQRQIARSG
jgi:hypothetical protein